MKIKKALLHKLLSRLNICFVIFLLATIYEFLYWVNKGSKLSFFILVLAGTITFLVHSLKKFFETIETDE